MRDWRGGMELVKISKEGQLIEIVEVDEYEEKTWS
jgi:hypothetical protein